MLPDGSIDERTIAAQAERIVSLERQLAARTEALLVVTDALGRAERTLAAVSGASVFPSYPVLSSAQRVRKRIILAGGRLLPPFAKRFVRRFWDPWARR